MTAQFAKDEMSFAAPANMSPNTAMVFTPEMFAPVAPEEAGRGFAARVRAVAGWIGEKMQRRAVMRELSLLSSHELTDIGLTRADIPRVFDQSFLAQRSTPKASRVR